jgi:hypothetical protein
MSVVAINALASPGSLADVIDAMRSVQTEADRWTLAESLAELIPSGEAGFSEIIDRATSEGLLGNFTVNTLRLYRDTAKRWAKDKRVADVSFSAHREAMSVKGDITTAAKLLVAQVKTVGSPAKVTASSVRKAVRIANGKAPVATAKVSPTATATTFDDVVSDLLSGGKKLAAAIGPDVVAADLDALHAGLSKVIAHVEKLRAKNARKIATAKKAAAAPKASGSKATPAKATPAKRPAARKQAGDLRGL